MSKCTLPQEILPIEFPIETCVSLSFFLHLDSLHPLHSYTLSSCVFQMDPSFTPYIGFADGAICFTRNLALVSWAIFTPFHSLEYSNDVCIGSTTNNQAEYDIVIDLFSNSLDHRILHLHVCLDSLLLACN